MPHSETTSQERLPPWRRRTATVILVLAALGAIFAFVMAITSINSAGRALVVDKSWRMFGLLVFAGLFVLLAYRPRQYPGVWELVIFHKAATAVFVGVFATNAVGATTTAVTDGVLAVGLIGAYLLVKGYESWSQLRYPSSDTPA